MKRRMLAALLAAVMVLGLLSACGGETAGTQPTPPAQTPEVTPEPIPEVTPEPTPAPDPTPKSTSYACEHTYGDWMPVNSKSPTCLEDGEMVKVCSKCHMGEVVTVPALGHTTETGVCDRCHEVVGQGGPSTSVPTPAPTPPPIQYDPVEPIDFTKLLSEVSTARREEMASTVTFDGFADYLVDDPAAKNLLTQEEINALKADHDMSETLTYAQAVSDVDLYFRALKYGYGAYYYFGGDEVFNAAKDRVLAELAGKSTIEAEQLGKILHKNMLFVRDGHFKVYGPSSIEQEDFSYEYFYCQGQEYAKDQNGYYKTLSGEKWYYVSCSNAAVTLQPTLTDSGKLVYSLVLFCPVTETDRTDTITLRRGSKTVTETVAWTLSEAYAETPVREPDIRFLEENHIVYTAVRNSDGSYDDILVEFEETGLAAKNADVVILDIRSHGGGGDRYARQWIENFTDHEMELKLAYSTRKTALDDGYEYVELGEELYVHSIFDGAFIENNIPVIVLVDDNCGSSGETMLLGAKTINNVLVIGSNSGGYQVCGNSMGFSLPNSGIHFSFGASLQFKYDMTNVDGKGYVPDVWCNPKTALEAVLNMVKEYDLADTGGLIRSMRHWMVW